MTTNHIPGIREIRMVKCADLPANVMFQSMVGCVIGLALPSTVIPFFGKPTLKWEGTEVNGGRQEKSTLEFASDFHIPTGERVAFVVSCVSGRQYLIGSREPKFPKVEYSNTTGTPGGDRAVMTYKITHLAEKSVLPCAL